MAEQRICLQHQGAAEEMKAFSSSEQGSIESEVANANPPSSAHGAGDDDSAAILGEIQSGGPASSMSAIAVESSDDIGATENEFSSSNPNINDTVELEQVFDGSAMNDDLTQSTHIQYAGEVYGEKSILATEMRELQSRLINLSDERDGSLSILDEMNQTLEARLATAKEIRVAAEKEKQEGRIAHGLLAEQELIMEKVVQESKRLQKEADENSKLRDFLMDYGRTVDILQRDCCYLQRCEIVEREI